MSRCSIENCNKLIDIKHPWIFCNGKKECKKIICIHCMNITKCCKEHDDLIVRLMDTLPLLSQGEIKNIKL